MSLIVLLALGTSFIARAEIENAVEAYIRARVARSPTEDMIVEFRSVPDRLVVTGHEHSIRVPSLAACLSPGNVSVPVEVISGDRVEQQCIVSVKVRTFDSVLVAGRQLNRHEVIRHEDVRRERMETTALREPAMTERYQLDHLRTRRIIVVGTVLTSELLEPVPLIAQGSHVTLVVKTKGIRLSMDAIVKEDGFRAKQVDVLKVGSRTRVRATVIDEKTVEMEIQ
jgi:flagella basal body P-ring formation protein FlgA